MHPFAKEFFQVAKSQEYSDLLEDTEWGTQNSHPFIVAGYSDLLEDTEWSTRTDDMVVV
tara:strand:- start:27 stop:203 length:177 start_codon:yes stop_codon:yes gene_type:complete